MNLIRVARSEGKFRPLATQLASQNGIRAEVIAADLAQENAAKAIQSAVEEKGLQVNMLINNAGFGTHGPFESLSPQRDHEEVMVNVTALVDLTHAFVPAMAARGEGAIINVASVAGFQPVPYMAIYGATKAFVLSFSEALWGEYQGRGVRVLALCPGPVSTNFFNVVGTRDAAVGTPIGPEKVVGAALRALERGKSFVIPGTSNYLLSNVAIRLVPRALTARVWANMMRPRKQ